MKKRRVTITDVARAARVHHSTVSLALRDHPSIPPATRERIRQAVAEVGYQPDPTLAALSRRRLAGPEPKMPRIAYVTNHSPEMGFYEYAYPVHFLQGAREEALKLGFELDLQFVAPDFHDSDSLSAYLEQQGINGILLAALQPGSLEVTLDWEKYSVVKIDSHHLPPRAPIVTNDQLQMTRLGFRRMAALGYRRIGLIVGLADETATNQRYSSGYAIEQASTPECEWIPPLLYPYNTDRNTVTKLIGRWVRRYQVDAVLSNLTIIRDFLESEGLAVPRDVACGCLCLFERFDELAGVVANLRLVGARAVAQLAEQMRASERGMHSTSAETYLRGFWRDGPTAPPKGSLVAPIPEPLPADAFPGVTLLPTATVPPGATPSDVRPRMRDVAARAGVSTTTVSLALHNHPSIPEATRDRVRLAADELGYRPDPMLDAFNYHRASLLRPQPQHTIAFIADSSPNLEVQETFHCNRLRWDGLTQGSEALGIHVERFILTPDLTPARLGQILFHRGITGIVVSPFRSKIEQLDLDWDRFSAVKIESAHLAPTIDMVSSDQRGAVQTAFDRMRALGYRRIGLLTWEDDERRLERSFCAGLLIAHSKIPAADRVRPWVFRTEDIPALATSIPAWIEAERLDAVITNWNNLFVHVRPTGRESTGFASLDLRPDDPTLAGVIQNHIEVGRRALVQVSVLMRSNIRGVPRQQAITLVPCLWRDGPTALAH